MSCEFLRLLFRSFFKDIKHLPLDLLGYNNSPAIPLELDDVVESLVRLAGRLCAIQEPFNGLSNIYEINNHSAPAKAFLFGDSLARKALEDIEKIVRDLKSAGSRRQQRRVLGKMFLESIKADSQDFELDASELTRQSLDAPDQFSMTWTNYQNVRAGALPHLDQWSKTLKDQAVATKEFWPAIANYGSAYNLLLLQKLDATRVGTFRTQFGSQWSAQWDSLSSDGRLFGIDLSIFSDFETSTRDGFTRFTPGTIVLLAQDASTKDLAPIAVRVSGFGGGRAQVFEKGKATDSAWIWSLFAAKASLTVYGIWLGHVYHWHIVTAAMQMTFLNNVGESHLLSPLLRPQFNYLIQFDEILLALWKRIAPPTSFGSAKSFVGLTDRFAAGRDYFDDDPMQTLQRNGITESDFTLNAPWDKYSIVNIFQKMWSNTDSYIASFVDESYPSDTDVSRDRHLQKWMSDSRNDREGNIRGLPKIDSKANLKAVLTSLVYRITMHGCSRLNSAANPGLTFVANFPPCLQNAAIPEPSSDVSLDTLLQALPKTGTMGEMMQFYYIFVFTEPYEPIIPTGGVQSQLFFDGGVSSPLNQALITFRNGIIDVMKLIEPTATPLHQWPMNIET